MDAHFTGRTVAEAELGDGLCGLMTKKDFIGVTTPGESAADAHTDAHARDSKEEKKKRKKQRKKQRMQERNMLSFGGDDEGVDGDGTEASGGVKVEVGRKGKGGEVKHGDGVEAAASEATSDRDSKGNDGGTRVSVAGDDSVGEVEENEESPNKRQRT